MRNQVAMAVDDIDIWERCAQCCCRQTQLPPQRTVHINCKPSDVWVSTGKEVRYPGNTVVTSRYTWWNFLPKNLFEQFMRIANSYFLIVAILQILNPDSPTSWVTSVAPLIFVLAVTAVKQGYEDILRHKEDRKVNHRRIDLVRDGRIEVVRSKSLHVGDIIRVAKNEPFPCDLILLSSDSPKGECYVTTASLDGETNLKVYRSVRETKLLTDAKSLSALRGTIECEQPTVQLYKFSGRILLDPRTISTSVEPLVDANSQPRTVVTQPTTKTGVANAAFEPASDDVLENGNRNGVNAYTNPAFSLDSLEPHPDISKQQSAITNHVNNANVLVAALDEKNVLLRGARLRNTDFVFGCVVYTGPETKLALNSRGKRIKMSRVEKRINIYLIIMFCVLMAITFLSCGLVYYFRFMPIVTNAWYMQTTVPADTALQVVIEWLNYFILYNYLIPISLYVTIELQKFIGSLFFGWDEEMFEPRMRERAKVNTSDLNEELGQVEYLFSDKTGTLTENEMRFRECSISGTRYVDCDGRLFTRSANQANVSGIEAPLSNVTHTDDNLMNFFTVLALCHTCRVECAEATDVQNETNRIISRRESTVSKPASPLKAARAVHADANDGKITILKVQKHDELDTVVNGNPTSNQNSSPNLTGDESEILKASGALYEYQASSPDEKALLIASRSYGVVYHGMVDENVMVISKNRAVLAERPASPTDWSFERYRLLHVLEFDSTRKCMSVIVQDETGEYWLLTKGAESSMFERAASHNDEKQRQIMEHIAEYATRGLRTLVIGRRIISPDEYVTLDHNLRDAQLAIADRESALQAAYRTVEKDLELLGATGVEDRLQDGVGETIEGLRNAGIIVWVLTGDKEETAVNIAQSCSLFSQEMRVLRFTQQPDTAGCQHTLRTLLEQTELETNQPDYGLVIDGTSLALALDNKLAEHHSLKQMLLDLCLKCKSVLCCRVTPLQKAEIVRMVKHGVKGAVTCAIGDGANDVSMIQEAHVGLGIFGMEGRQAAQTSDYCFARFRYLSRALLLHGHYFYRRLSILVLYFFYKNVVYVFNQFFYQFLGVYSAVSLYDSLSLSIFNVTYSTLPVLLYGLFEQHIHRDLLVRQPKLYRLARRNATLSYGNFFQWQLLGVYQAAVICFGSYVFFQFTTESTLPDGTPLDSYTFGAFTLLCVILTVHIRLMIEMRYWSPFAFGSFTLTILIGFFGILILYEIRLWSVSSYNYSYFVFVKALSYPLNWLLCFAIIIVGILPDLIIKAVIDTRSSECKMRLMKAIRRRRQKRAAASPQQQSQLQVAPSIPAPQQYETVNLASKINGNANNSSRVSPIVSEITISSRL